MQTHSTHDAPQQTAALPPALANINSKVLDDAILKKLVDPDIYDAFARCRATNFLRIASSSTLLLMFASAGGKAVVCFGASCVECVCIVDFLFHLRADRGDIPQPSGCEVECGLASGQIPVRCPQPSWQHFVSIAPFSLVKNSSLFLLPPIGLTEEI